MKKQNILIGILICTLLSINIMAIGGPIKKTTRKTTPTIVLKDGSKIAVAIYKDDNSSDALSDKIATEFASKIKSSTANQTFTEWYNINPYEGFPINLTQKNLANNISEDQLIKIAKEELNTSYLLCGSYSVNYKEDSVAGYKSYRTTEGIPYKRFEIDYTLTMELKYNIKLINCATNAVIETFTPFKKTVFKANVKDKKIRTYTVAKKVRIFTYNESSTITNRIANYFKIYSDNVEYKFFTIRKLEDSNKKQEKGIRKTIKKATTADQLKSSFYFYNGLTQIATLTAKQKSYALYNCAILQEMVGNYEMAIQLYDEAIKTDGSEIDFVNAKKRANKSLLYKNALKTIGFTINDFVF